MAIHLSGSIKLILNISPFAFHRFELGIGKLCTDRKTARQTKYLLIPFGGSDRETDTKAI